MVGCQDGRDEVKEDTCHMYIVEGAGVTALGT